MEAVVPAQQPTYWEELLGSWTPQSLKAEVHETEPPIDFTYSLYYVYYD